LTISVTIDPSIPYPPESQFLKDAGRIYLLKFTNLGGGSIESVSVRSSGFAGGGLVGVIYDDSGTQEYLEKFDFDTHDGTNLNPGKKIFVSKISGLPPGEIIDTMWVDSGGNGPNWCGVIYGDSGGNPSGLLGQSADGGAGANLVRLGLCSPVTIPASGIIWAGVMTASAHAYFTRTTGAGGKLSDHTASTYGCGDAQEVGGLTDTTHEIRVGVHYTNTTTGTPGNLLGQSLLTFDAQAENVMTMITPVQIPASGNVWAGFADKINGLNIYGVTDIPIIEYSASHATTINVDFTTIPPTVSDPFPITEWEWVSNHMTGKLAFWTKITYTAAGGQVYSYIIG
jgi:hypothetical protein